MKGQREIKKQEELSTPNPITRQTEEIIKKIEEKRNSKLFVFICHKSITGSVAYKLSKVLRRLGDTEHLDIFLESGGGDLDSAYKILNMFRTHAKKTTVIVPFFAKSAASLIALGVDELLLLKTGELGPLDPQVMDPQTSLFVPAHSIKETMDFIDEVNDPLVKLSLTDKVPALLVGAYRAAGKASKQYLDEILSKKQNQNKQEIIDTFTERFLSHGYPMDKEFLIENKICVNNTDPELEKLFGSLHESYIDCLTKLYRSNQEEEGLLVQSGDAHIFELGNQTVSEKLD